MNKCCVCNNNDTINVTRDTDINLIVTLSREGNPFPIELCEGVQVNVISEYGHRHTVSFEMGIGRLLVTIIAEEYKVGMYGIEVKGMLNGMSWLTFGSKIFKYTYETRNGLSSTNNAGDPYDVLLEVTHVADAIPKNISDLNDDVGLITDPDYVHTDNNFTNEEKEKLALLSGWTTNYIESITFDDPIICDNAVLTFVQNYISQPAGAPAYNVNFRVPYDDIEVGKIYESIFILHPQYDTYIAFPIRHDMKKSGDERLIGGQWNYVHFTWAVTGIEEDEYRKHTGYVNVQVHADFYDMIKHIDTSSYVQASEKGAAGGVATLGNDGKVPLEQLPPIASDDMFLVKEVEAGSGEIYWEATHTPTEIQAAYQSGKVPIFIGGRTTSTECALYAGIKNGDAVFVSPTNSWSELLRIEISSDKSIMKGRLLLTYNDISDAPTDVSYFANDAGYLVAADIANKVDKETGKGLSSNDYTTTEKTKLADLPTANALTTALSNKQDVLTFDNTPTAGSNNPVKSSGIKTALDNKQDNLTFDNVPTANSNNPVKSGGVYSELQKKQDKTLVEQVAFTAAQATAKTIDPNKIYECTFVDVMSFAFNSETITNSEKCEYCIKFNVGATVPTLTLPSGIKWAEELELNASTHYVLLINYENGGYYGDWKGYEL